MMHEERVNNDNLIIIIIFDNDNDFICCHDGPVVQILALPTVLLDHPVYQII